MLLDLSATLLQPDMYLVSATPGDLQDPDLANSSPGVELAASNVRWVRYVLHTGTPQSPQRHRHQKCFPSPNSTKSKIHYCASCHPELLTRSSLPRVFASTPGRFCAACLFPPSSTALSLHGPSAVSVTQLYFQCQATLQFSSNTCDNRSTKSVLLLGDTLNLNPIRGLHSLRQLARLDRIRPTFRIA